ncbi:methyltransferase domain-containing protein [Umezawaea endophytica]|uniref:Methyltransferase domain-containing protein n=1 Tax=Umezawaea endophytica TaxID=1654476 RepID=A0A9X2VS05_9PSEU|nr:methyltransferase domain-containing protein [Umezawaea endophytica]MCS7481571.1 methyltransferase domain-containing protein [Umezawaea endophytica]
MDLGFAGEVADFYASYRRGYPAEVFDDLVSSFGLTGEDTVLDLGCGTGQLAVPMAERVGHVLAVDPSPDMLARGPRRPNITWQVGSDADLPAHRGLGAVTVGQALHWMDHERLFRALDLRPGGGIAVVTNGTPLWLQDTAWSRALREVLEDWLGTTAGATCGTADADQRRYRAALVAAGYDVSTFVFEYTDDLDLEHVVGGVYSALPLDRLPTKDRRPLLEERIRRSLEPHRPFVEHVRVSVLKGLSSPRP